MPHPQYGPPSHRLSSVQFTLSLPLRATGYLTRLEVVGRASTKRGALWSVTEQWSTDEQECGYQPADALHHLALIALQDTPATQAALFRQLTGADHVQELLPFT